MPKKKDKPTKNNNKVSTPQVEAETPQVDLDELKDVLSQPEETAAVENEATVEEVPETEPIAPAPTPEPSSEAVENNTTAEVADVIPEQVTEQVVDTPQVVDSLDAVATAVPEQPATPKKKEKPTQARRTWREMMGYDWNGQIYE